MSTRKSLFYSFLDRYAGLVIAIGSSMVIARLLTPSEIGVFSVVMVLLSFISTFREMGVGQYLVQEKELTIDRIRAAWAVLFGLGITMTCIVLATSYPLAAFYQEPRLLEIMLVVAFNYAINPFGALTYAWLTREMRFEKLALMRFLSSVAGAVVSIVLAWKHYGPISLAFGSLSATVVNAGVAVFFRPSFFPWLPGTKEIRRVLSFGSKVTVSALLQNLAISAPEIFLGKLQSMAYAGFYSRANGLVSMFHRLFADAVNAVCVPWFAKMLREQQGFAEPFLKVTAYATALGWAFCFAVALLAHPLIRFLYGPQWDQAVDLTRLLAVAMAFAVPSVLSYSALLAAGAVTTLSKVVGISTVVTLFFVALGSNIGLNGLGWGLVIATCINSALMIRATLKELALSWSALMKSSRASGGVSILAAIGPAGVVWWFGLQPKEIFLPLAIGGPLGVLGFVAGVMLLRHPLHTEFVRILPKLRTIQANLFTKE